MGKKSKKRSRSESEESSSNESTDSEELKKRKKKSEKKHRKKESRRSPSEERPKKKSTLESKKGSSRVSLRAETEEERKARKAAKRAKQLASVFGYTNDSNPFGDSNLHQQFVWHKKEKVQGKNPAETKRHEELILEIDKVRKRREQREKELEEMEKQKAEEAKLREAELFQDWEKKEEEFHHLQSKTRSKIRLVEGREKPIDIMAKNILLFGEEDNKQVGVKYTGKNVLDLSNLEAELREPYLIFEDIDSVEVSISVYPNFESSIKYNY